MRLHVYPLDEGKYRWGWQLRSNTTYMAAGDPKGYTTSEGAIKSVAKVMGGLYLPSKRQIVRREPMGGGTQYVVVIIHDQPPALIRATAQEDSA